MRQRVTLNPLKMTVYQLTFTLSWRLAVWLSSNASVLINEVALRRAWLVRGWVTVLGRINHFCAEPAKKVYSAWPSLCG